MLKKWEDLPEQFKTEEVRQYYDVLKKKKFGMFCKRVFDIIVSLIMLGVFFSIAENDHKNKVVNNLTKLLMNAFGQIFFFACGILVYAILVNWLGISSRVSAIISVIAYGFFSLCTTFVTGCAYNE